jgi:hypothetical protein
MYSHTANVRKAIEQTQQRNVRGTETTDGFYGPLTGKWYDSLEAMHHYETREAMHRNVDPADILLAGLTPEQIRALDERARKSEQEKVNVLLMGKDLLTFKDLHPEYMDGNDPAGDANMKAMVGFFVARGIKHPTLPELEDAYESLTARGLLQLNQAELNRQVKAESQERARRIQARGGVAAVAANTPTESEEELERMPLEEIRRRATPGGWLR